MGSTRSAMLTSMANTVEFPVNGHMASGYLVTPPSGSGPGVLVIQEWWGLDSGIKEMADRLGAAGFVAPAPDLYHGELAGHDEMDKAGELMQGLPPDGAGRVVSGADDSPARHPADTSKNLQKSAKLSQGAAGRVLEPARIAPRCAAHAA